MLLFSLPHFERLGSILEELARLRHGRCTIDRFSNQELHAAIHTPVADTECLVLGSTAPPDENLLSTLLLGHTLRKEGARSVTAVLPYLGYARHDRMESGRSLGTAWVGALLRSSGVDRVVTVDVHSPMAQELFPIPLHSLSPAPVLAGEIPGLGLHEPTVVAPDEGALERCEAVRQAAGIARPVAYFVKRRTSEGLTHSMLHGDVGREAIVVDDILDTGGTLVSAGEGLRRAGTQTITVMATHGLFTGARWERLWALGVQRIYCTDTVPLAPRVASQPVTVLSIAPLLAAHLTARSW